MDRSIQDAFGKIDPKSAEGGEKLGFLKYGEGAEGLGNFLSRAIELTFIVAGVVLIFMILWGAWDWIISGGEKEKVASARDKIIHAIIGIVIFGISFAIIRVLGIFLGFEFFQFPS